MHYPIRKWPRFTLRAVFLAVSTICVLLAWRVSVREKAKLAAALRQRQDYVSDVLRHIYQHEAIRHNELLRDHRMYFGSSGSSFSEQEPGRFTIEERPYGTSSNHKLPEWPVDELKKAFLSSLVRAAKDMQLLSKVTITMVTPDCAVVAGTEGCLVWHVVGIVKEKRATSGSPPHSLRLLFNCRGQFRFDEPFDVTPKLYKLGIEPERALHSDDPNERFAGAEFISILKSRTEVDAVLAAIDRETNERVLSALFGALELRYQGQPYDPGPYVLARLRRFLEEDRPAAPLAARTLLRGEHLFALFEAQRTSWSSTALQQVRRACIDVLTNGSREYWAQAAKELERQMTPDDKEAVEAMVAAIECGGPQSRADGLLYLSLRGNPHAIKPLFALLAASEEPEVWYSAAEIIAASAGHVDADGNKVRDRVRGLSGKPKHRMQVVGSYSEGYRDQLQAMGNDAFEFLSPLVDFRTWENAPSLYTRATDMLAKLGDQRAVPLLVRAVEDHYRHGNLDDMATAFGAAHLVKAVNELTGRNIGGLGVGPTVGGDEVEACNWTAIRQELADPVGD
jgi:hypothetical protein